MPFLILTSYYRWQMEIVLVKKLDLDILISIVQAGLMAMMKASFRLVLVLSKWLVINCWILEKASSRSTKAPLLHILTLPCPSKILVYWESPAGGQPRPGQLMGIEEHVLAKECLTAN